MQDGRERREGRDGTAGRHVILCVFGLLLSITSWAPALGSDLDPPTPEGSANPLLTAEPEVLLREGEIVLLAWKLDDEPSLWQTAPSGLRHLSAWRDAVEEVLGEEIVPGTDATLLIRRNRELYPWLESENRAVRRINRAVEEGEMGRLRRMNALEAFLLDFHAARYPLFERPSELGALILSRASSDGSRIRVYYLTDGDGLPPKRGSRTVLERARSDVRAGWDLRAFLHNHTFDLASERGMLAIAAPSESDVHFIRGLAESLELDEAWIVDGFHSIELQTDDLVELEISDPAEEERIEP